MSLRLAIASVNEENFDALCSEAPVAGPHSTPPRQPQRQGLLLLSLLGVVSISPANDLTGLIAWLTASPDKALHGTVGQGSPEHIAGILFQHITDTRFQFAHYRGAALLMQDLVAGYMAE